jgi:hypothetical protein
MEILDGHPYDCRHGRDGGRATNHRQLHRECSFSIRHARASLRRDKTRQTRLVVGEMVLLGTYGQRPEASASQPEIGEGVRSIPGAKGRFCETGSGAVRLASASDRGPNITPFAPFDGLPPLHKVDQATMRRLRKLADQRGSSVEKLIHEAIEQWVALCEAERELETKVIRFPKR